MPAPPANQTGLLNLPILYYFADPMCSWCYGFAPVMDRICADYAEELDIRLVMGGLRPGKLAQQMTPAIARVIRHHWREVAKMTGQTFDETFFARENFNYDTEPAAKAVITMERLAGAHAYRYYHEIQAVFYSRNQDITQPSVLAEIATRYGVAPAAFLEFYESEAAQRETWSQFEFCAALGIRGFPALVLEPLNEAEQNSSQSNKQFYLVTRGWQPYEQIVAAIAHVMKTAPGAIVAGESCEIDGTC